MILGNLRCKMKKLSTKQWILITFEMLNIVCLITYIVSVIPTIYNTYSNIENNLTRLNLITIPILILFAIFMFVIVSFVLFYLFKNSKHNYTNNLIFLYVCWLVINISYIAIYVPVTIIQCVLQNLSINTLNVSIFITPLVAVLYVAFFIWCVIDEIKFKKQQKFIVQIKEMDNK